MPVSGFANEVTAEPLPVMLRRVAEVLEAVPDALASVSVTVYLQVPRYSGPAAERVMLIARLAGRLGLGTPVFMPVEGRRVHYSADSDGISLFTALTAQQAAEVGGQ